jgi:hypothetical protein
MILLQFYEILYTTKPYFFIISCMSNYDIIEKLANDYPSVIIPLRL